VIEILADLDVLRRPKLTLGELSLDGVPFGAKGRAIPRDRIVEVSGSPLVYSSHSGTAIRPQYFDEAGRELPLDRVIDSVIDSNGMLHFANKISFKIIGGEVVGFAIYGPQRHVFGTLEGPDDVIAVFGTPDRSRENSAYGDLMGWDFYYDGSRKQVSWDAFDRRIHLINLGDYPREY
jgi:hypothetical protein